MGTFAYGASYYGLRSFDQTTGVVNDASATVNAVSSIATVNWAIAIAGDASMSSSSSSTCSGEVVIIEETDKFSYGSGLYGLNEYDQTDLQTIISVTSSFATVTPLVYRQIPVTISATSTVSVLGGMTLNGVATTTTTSTVSSGGVRYREGSAIVSDSSSTTVTPTCTFSDSVSITATSSVSANAEKFFLESSDKLSYGTGLYGLNEYDQADLQTIISATSVASTCSGEKINLVSAISSASASNTAIGEKINLGVASMSSSSTSTASSVFVASGDGSMTSTSGTTIAFIRKRNASGIVSSTSGVATIAREKWEIVSPTSATWNTIAETSQTWTDIAA